jgi:hypothetical protein
MRDVPRSFCADELAAEASLPVDRIERLVRPCWKAGSPRSRWSRRSPRAISTSTGDDEEERRARETNASPDGSQAQ